MATLRYTTSRAISLLVLLTSAFADTVTLKTGERIEGKIVSETDTELKLEVKISAAVSDERVVAKADVTKVEKTSAESEAFKAIQLIQPGSNSLTPAQYEPLLRPLQAYVAQFPASPQIAEVQKTLKAFEEEKKRVEAGEVKLHHQWLNKEEADQEEVQIKGLLTFEYMKARTAANDVIGALNAFVLHEKSYPGAATMPDAIELARQLVAALGSMVDRAIPNQKIIKAEREKGFAAAGPADRVELKAAYLKEQTQAEEMVAAATATGKWPPLIPGSEKCLTTLKALVVKEIPRLEKLPVDKMKKSVQLANAAKQKHSAKDLEGAAALLKEATLLWPANELATRMTKEIASLKEEEKKSAPATPPPATATPKPATPRATPKPSAAVAAPAKTGEESKPFYMTLGGAVTIVVGVAGILVGVNVYKKMKSRGNDAPQ